MAGRRERRDDELSRSLLKGNADALKAVIDAFAPAVTRQLATSFRTLQPEDLEEVIAVAAFRLWESRDRYDPKKSSLAAWFSVIARSAALDLLRRRHRAAGVGFGGNRAVEPVWEHPLPGARDVLDADPVRQALEAILMRLPEVDRAILLTFAEYGGEGGWVETAAQRTGLSAANVRVKKMRLLGRIRDELLSLRR